jgi:hypothetical protein
VEELYQALIELAEQPGPLTRTRVRHLFLQGNARAVIDPLLTRLRSEPPARLDRFYEEMKRIFMESGYRDEVKFALSILSCFGSREDIGLFRIIGRHEEFTSYAAAALARLGEDPIAEWMALVGKVTEWGKVELVERLLRDPRPEVCGFLLRHGCRGDVLDSYIALEIAVTCRLHDALAADEVDAPLLAGAGAILSILARDATEGGPGRDMTDYPEGGWATERFLTHFEPQARTLGDFLRVDTIRALAAGEYRHDQLSTDGEEQLPACGWEPPRRSRILDLCHRILDRPEWKALAEKALVSQDRGERLQAVAVIQRLGQPLWDVLVSGLERDPLDAALWSYLVHEVKDEAGMEAVLGLVFRLFDVEAIASGPRDHIGMGPGFELHFCLSFVLRALVQFPGKGWELLRPALQSPSVQNRSAAVGALANWAVSDLTAEIREALAGLRSDPDESVRAACLELLRRIEKEQ